MGKNLEAVSDSTVKTVLLVGLIVLAVGALVFFVARANGGSGTVEDKPQQMQAGARSRTTAPTPLAK